MGEELFTAREVATKLKVHINTVEKLLYVTRELGHTKVGRCTRIPAAELAAYLERRRVAPKGDK